MFVEIRNSNLFNLYSLRKITKAFLDETERVKFFYHYIFDFSLPSIA